MNRPADLVLRVSDSGEGIADDGPGPDLRALLLDQGRMAAASAWRLCTASCRSTAARSTSRAARAPAPPSPSPCRRPCLRSRVLVVDDEQSMRDLLAIMLRRRATTWRWPTAARRPSRRSKAESFDLVVTDLRMRKVDGMAGPRAAKEHSPRTVVLVVTAFASTETAVEAMKLGAYDYITKPFKLDELKLTVANAPRAQAPAGREPRPQAPARDREHGFENFVGQEPARSSTCSRRSARSPTAGSTVMITGESGTGKELVARAIHSRVQPARAGRSCRSTAARSPRA